MVTNRKRKYLRVLALLTSLYGVVNTTNATDTYDLYSKNRINKIKPGNLEYTSNKNWGDDITIQLSQDTENLIIDKTKIGIVVKVNSTLNVRSTAELGDNVIGTLAVSTRVKILESKDGWDKIEFAGEKQTYGYVSGIYLERENNSDTETNSTTKPSKKNNSSYGSLAVFGNREG